MIHPDTADTQPSPLPRQQSTIKKISTFLQLSKIGLYVGAGLSIIDMLFDIAMIIEYYNTNRVQFAKASLASICLNLIFQSCLVIIQNQKRGKFILLREVLSVVTLVKPGVDVYRVLAKQEHAKNAMFSPMTEMVFTKSVELTMECIPGTVIQSMAFVAGSHSNVAILSLTSSVLTAAFISASIGIEKDINKDCRHHSPNFYGLVDLKSRRQAAAVCVLVLLMSACQLASKAFAVALCSVESGTILSAYLSIDMGLAFIYKMTRGDFRYWLPIESSAMSIFASLVARLGGKINLDFTGSIQYRHPYEYGGVYFQLVLLTTPLVSLYFGSRYLSFVKDEEVKPEFTFTSDQIYGGLGCLAAVQLFSFALLMSIIPPKIRKTFFSTQTGQQYTCTIFETAQNDLAKIEVFGNHSSLYAPIKEEIKEWLNEQLPVWITEEPDWFDDQKKATIPDDFVADPAMLLRIRGVNIEKIRERRRSSLGGLTT